MPRVLIVSYPWLPMFNVGVKHVATLCRYLPAAGWDPHILTKDWSDGPAPEDSFWGMTWGNTSDSPSLKLAAEWPTDGYRRLKIRKLGAKWRWRNSSRVVGAGSQSVWRSDDDTTDKWLRIRRWSDFDRM